MLGAALDDPLRAVAGRVEEVVVGVLVAELPGRGVGR